MKQSSLISVHQTQRSQTPEKNLESGISVKYNKQNSEDGVSGPIETVAIIHENPKHPLSDLQENEIFSQIPVHSRDTLHALEK